MPRDPRAYLWDALNAADAIAAFTHGEEREDFEKDLLLRSAVERQFQIVGEELNQLSRHAPDLAQQIPDLPRIVAFRNILVHAYAAVDNDTVRQAVQAPLPLLQKTLRRLLDEG